MDRDNESLERYVDLSGEPLIPMTERDVRGIQNSARAVVGGLAAFTFAIAYYQYGSIGEIYRAVADSLENVSPMLRVIAGG